LLARLASARPTWSRKAFAQTGAAFFVESEGGQGVGLGFGT
jgi:hypothetical protein